MLAIILNLINLIVDLGSLSTVEVFRAQKLHIERPCVSYVLGSCLSELPDFSLLFSVVYFIYLKKLISIDQ